MSDPRIAQAEDAIVSGRFDALQDFERRYGRNFESAPEELRAKLLAIRDGGVERSLRPSPPPCRQEGCASPAGPRGLCSWHDPDDVEDPKA